jgi:hypothetical protein
MTQIYWWSWPADRGTEGTGHASFLGFSATSQPRRRRERGDES